MPDSNYTHMVFILDASGSMSHRARSTRDGFNQMIADQKKIPGQIATVTTVTFSNTATRLHGEMDIHEVPMLDHYNYVPNGGTALLDTIAETLREENQLIHRMEPHEQPGLVIVTIITDGQENGSKQFSRQQVKDMIEWHQDRKGWKFVFLGANQDAFAEARNLGIATGLSTDWNQSRAGTEAMYKTTSEMLGRARNYASKGSTEKLNKLEWSAEEREAITSS